MISEQIDNHSIRHFSRIMVVYYCRRQKPYKCRLFLNEHLVYTFLLETIFTHDQFVLNVFLLPFGLTSFETTDAFQDITVNSHVGDNLISYIINRNHSSSYYNMWFIPIYGFECSSRGLKLMRNELIIRVKYVLL